MDGICHQLFLVLVKRVKKVDADQSGQSLSDSGCSFNRNYSTECRYMRRFVKPMLCLKLFTLPNQGHAQHTVRWTTDLTSVHYSKTKSVAHTLCFTGLDPHVAILIQYFVFPIIISFMLLSGLSKKTVLMFFGSRKCSHIDLFPSRHVAMSLQEKRNSNC